MPLYEYYCEKDDKVFEALASIAKRDVPVRCPTCGRAADRLMPTTVATMSRVKGLVERVPFHHHDVRTGKKKRTIARVKAKATRNGTDAADSKDAVKPAKKKARNPKAKGKKKKDKKKAKAKKLLMPVYEYYCRDCHAIFEEIRQMREASLPADCPECTHEAPRIMSGFQAFTFRDGYPRRIPDKGTYWHMGKEVKSKAKSLKGNQHPELYRPKPKPRPTKGDRAVTIERKVAQRADLLYRDRWGVTGDGRRSVKAKKIKPERKIV
jgi:putative FmdB family regulatory protein